jgi:hypothetical protein
MASLIKGRHKKTARDIDGILIIFSIAIGLISGILRPLFFDEDTLALLVNNLRHFTETFNASELSLTILAESLIRYGRPLLLIWACAVLPKAYYAGFLVLYLRAMTFGFSTAMMVHAFGGQGLLMAATLYGLQNLIIIPFYAFTVYFIARNLPSRQNRRKIIKMVVIGAAVVVMVSIIEVYIGGSPIAQP